MTGREQVLGQFMRALWISFLMFAMTAGAIGSVSFASPMSVDFTVNMSEAVNVSGCPADCPRIAINVGGQTRYAEYSAGTGTSSLTFSYSPTIGDLDLDGVVLVSPVDLNGGTIIDLNGNPMADLTFSLPNTAGVRIDYPSLSMDFLDGESGRYTLNGTAYNSLSAFLSATGGTFARNSSATYFDSTGTLQTAAVNQPRFDHDPITGTKRGLLMEEQRTNLLRHSNGFTQPQWTACVAMPTSTTTTAPDGSSVPVYSFSTTQCLYQDVAVAIGDKLTHSIWIKANKAATIGFRVPGISIFTNQSISVGTSWKRYTISNTASHTVTRFLLDNRSSTGFGVAGLELAFFGAQVEKGGFVTSYIPTAATSATRGADALYMPTGAWYNQSQGSFYNDIAWETVNNSVFPMFFRFDDGTSNNRWNSFYFQDAGEMRVSAFNGGVNQGSSGVSKPFAGSAKIAAAQALNNANVAFDGNIQTLITSWSPPLVTRLEVGGGNQANKWFKELRYYPSRVPDDQLRFLTQ